MGVQLHEHVAPLPLSRRRNARIDRRSAVAIAQAGRFGVCWLPAYALLSSRAPSLSDAVGLATVLALVWFAALRQAYQSSRATLLSLGPAVGAAIGTATGAVGVSALSLWIDLHLSAVQLAEMGLAVFVLGWAWERTAQRSLAGLRRVVVVGSEAGHELRDRIAAEERSPFEVVDVVDESDVETLYSVVEAQRPDIVVLASPEVCPVAFDRLLDAATSGFRLVGLPEFYEHAFGRVPVETVRGTWFMNVLHLYQRPYTRVAKRAFDVAVASLGLLAVSWLLPILYVLVRRTGGPGPVIFRQTRLGEGGRFFTIYKFRTMRNDAEASGAVWAQQDDPRVTRVGKIMRKTRLDELPQLVNVLKGEMSVVGPRPERPEFLAELRDAVPFWARRHLVKPGITGWAQVRRGYTADADGTAEKLAYDLWYLRHRSLVLDVAICIQTFTTMFTGSGAR